MTPHAASPAQDRALTVEELLSDEVLTGADLIAGRAGIGRGISALNVMTVPDIGRWVRQDEFLLATGYPLPRDDAGQVKLLRDLHELGLAGIGIKLDQYIPGLSQDIVEVADRLGLPLVLIPERIRFDDILSRAFSTIVNRQAAVLARAQELHRSFLEITLTGGGLGELGRQLSDLLGGASVLIADTHGTVLAHAGDRGAWVGLDLLTGEDLAVGRLTAMGLHAGPAGAMWAAQEIRAGTLHHGYVVAAEGREPFGELGAVAVDQAAIVAALEITRNLAVGAVERRFSANALLELVTGGESDLVDPPSRGLGLGWNLDRDVVVLVGRRERGGGDASSGTNRNRLAEERAIDFWTSAVRSHDRAAAAAGLGAELVAVVGAERDVPALARSVQAELTKFARGEFAIGVSRSYRGCAEIPTAYQEARAALHLGHRVSGPGAVTAYGELGLFRLLAQVGEEELKAFAEETLGPLLALAEPERSDMFATLEALVERNMNMAETARHLHYHYNTLRYRLQKLERLLGEFSTNASVAMQVFIALQITDMQKNLNHRPGRS